MTDLQEMRAEISALRADIQRLIALTEAASVPAPAETGALPVLQELEVARLARSVALENDYAALRARNAERKRRARRR